MDASYEKRYYRSTVVRCELDLCFAARGQIQAFSKGRGSGLLLEWNLALNLAQDIKQVPYATH